MSNCFITERSSSQPKIMQCSTREKNSIYKVIFPQPALILDYPIPFGAANGMLNANPERRNLPVRRLLFFGQLFSFGLFAWLNNCDIFRSEALITGISWAMVYPGGMV